MRTLPAFIGLSIAFCLLGVCYAYFVPIGEAPDEPAHLAYIDHVIRSHSLPPRPMPNLPSTYEAHQPPLDYLVSAFCQLVVAAKPVEYPFRSNPSFSFYGQGSRAFLPATAADETAQSEVRHLRVIRLFWGVLTLFLTLELVRSVGGNRFDLAALAAVPFVFSPQFLFVSSTINNDAAVTTFSAAALLGLVHLVLRTGRRTSFWASVTGVSAGLAIWSKASGFTVWLPALVTVVTLLRRRRWNAVVCLLMPLLVLTAAWLWLSFVRFHSLWPPPPTGFIDPGINLAKVVLSPHWLGSLWISFWAKFGWLNLHLPRSVYLFFVLPTFCAAWGLSAIHRLSPVRAAATLMLSMVGGNFVLLLAYIIRIDWQPQGRYLFPSLAALAGLASIGLRSLLDSQRVVHWRVQVAIVVIVITIAIASLGVFCIYGNYAGA